MFMPLIWAVAMAIFIAQLIMGFHIQNKLVRLVPVYVTGGFALICMACYFLKKHSFSAFILGSIGCCWAAAAVLAWAICTIVKIIQKRRK